jgi:hypothetical protein
MARGKKAPDTLIQALTVEKLPLKTFGECKNVPASKNRSRKCTSIQAVLGDGLCQSCWDLKCSTKPKEEVTDAMRTGLQA